MTNLAQKLKNRGTNCLALKQSQWMCACMCAFVKEHVTRIFSRSSSGSVLGSPNRLLLFIRLRILHHLQFPSSPLVFKVPHSGGAFFPSLLLLFLPFHPLSPPHPPSPPLQASFLQFKKKRKTFYLNTSTNKV